MDIDGKKIANEILEQIKKETSKMEKPPGLAFVLVGQDPASQAYVKMKEKRCQEVGFISQKIQLEEDVAEHELMGIIDKLNEDDGIDGILVQMPLPKHLNENAVIERVKPEKDVDGFHPINVGKYTCGDRSGFIPCTPLGILKLLEKSDVELDGANVVVLGRSNIVGRPIANLLSQKETIGNATVTLAHSRTKDLKELCRKADVIIAAIGQPKMITADMVKQGVVVIDVGINRTSDNTLVGDVDYESVKEKASKITPVPGGVGPMTIAMLLQNTHESAKRFR